MFVHSKAEALALNTSVGNQVITGLGFTPKLVLFFSEPDTTDIVADIANAHMSIGAFDGVSQWVMAYNSRNGVISSDTAVLCDNARVIFIADPAGTMTADYSVAAVSLDADGFTINVDNAPPINYRFYYIALGGDDLSVKVGNFQSGGGGNVITGVGFQPEAIMFCAVNLQTIPSSSSSDLSLCIGVATQLSSDPANWSAAVHSRNGVNPQIAKKQLNSSWPLDLINQSGSILGGGVSSFDVNGFTTGYFANPTGFRVGYVALRGGPNILFASGTDVLTSLVGQTTYAGLTFTPRFGLFASHGAPTDTLQNNHDLTIGAADRLTTGRLMVESQDINGVSPTNAAHASHSQRIMRLLSSAGVVTEDVDIFQWLSNGFILNQIVASATPSRFGYFVIGDTDEPAPPDPTLSDNYGIVV